MSYVTYLCHGTSDKHIFWLHGEIKTPPFGTESRLKAGLFDASFAKRRAVRDARFQTDAVDWQNCHELRINDTNKIWHIVYCIEVDAIVILPVFRNSFTD